MEIDDRSAKEHIHRWTKAWNDHNVKEVLSLYSENILFSSPKVKSVYPNRTSATITNKKDLEEYFCLGLKNFPMLHPPLGRAHCWRLLHPLQNANRQSHARLKAVLSGVTKMSTPEYQHGYPPHLHLG